ncbi:hypothetical protein FEM03_04315 [Phragmitibacter flavus]|uniref:Uncharacterized protein n=1 Tax=Phragmitibacter flavus TaxID=2576071 RepID=A0A5R8KI12_9BACT|nr:hypothetical protein [Phragmitibacter flavus]TLD71954.1 hypothetical protein FEM03_04315 [Phragmitibacter flavus]
MESIITANQSLLPWVYTTVNFLGFIFFILASAFKGWSKGELLLAIAAILSLALQVYWILMEMRITWISSGHTGRAIWFVHAFAEYVSIFCYALGAILIYRAARKRQPS